MWAISLNIKLAYTELFSYLLLWLNLKFLLHLQDNPIEPQRYYELFEKDTIKFGNSRYASIQNATSIFYCMNHAKLSLPLHCYYTGWSRFFFFGIHTIYALSVIWLFSSLWAFGSAFACSSKAIGKLSGIPLSLILKVEAVIFSALEAYIFDIASI